MGGTPRHYLRRVQRSALVGRRRRRTEHPDPRRINEKPLALRRQRREHADRDLVDLPRARAGLRRRVNRPIGRRRRGAPRRRLHQIPDDGVRAARLHLRRGLAVAHERINVMPAATSDSNTAEPTYPCTCEKTRIVHLRACRSRAQVFHHNSGHMTRRTLLDFFADVTADTTAKNAQFLAYDDGYRTWTWTYGELRLSARLRAATARPGRSPRPGHRHLEREPSGVDRGALGRAPRRVVLVPIDYRASPDFLLKVAGIVDAKAILVGDAVDAASLGTARAIWNLDTSERSRKPRATPARASRLPPSPRLRRTSAPRSSSRRRRPRSSSPRAPQPTQRRRPTHKNILANIVPIEREMAKYQKLHAPVPADPVPEPAAAQPHVRTGDGDLRSADAARAGRLHAQLLARRHRPADPRAPDLGSRLRPEDPRGAARLHRPRRARGGGTAAGRDALGQTVVALPPDPQDVRLQVLGDGRRRRAARSGAGGCSGAGSGSWSCRATG